MADLSCKKPTPCPPSDVELEIHPAETPAFSFCAGNQTVTWDGSRLRAETGYAVADGEYGTVVVENGCIVGYGQISAPTYTPPYCNPNPVPCGDGSGGGVSYSVSPAAGNILMDSTLGLYAKSYIQGSTGLTVSGTGTEANPYKISISAGSGVTKVTSDNPHVTIDNTVVGSPSIGLTTSPLAAGTYAGFSVDTYGFITGYSDQSDDVVGDVTAGTDLTVSNIGGTYTVSHPTQTAGNTTIRLGAFDVRISAGGHIETTTLQLNVDAGTYAVGGWLITVDAYGSITDISEDPTPKADASQAIIDIIDLTYNSTANSYTIQGLGAAQPTNAGGNGDAYSFTMPATVTNPNQVTIIGGAGLSITLIDTVPVKVQMTSFTAAGASVRFVIRGVQ